MYQPAMGFHFFRVLQKLHDKFHFDFENDVKIDIEIDIEIESRKPKSKSKSIFLVLPGRHLANMRWTSILSESSGGRVTESGQREIQSAASNLSL